MGSNLSQKVSNTNVVLNRKISFKIKFNTEGYPLENARIYEGYTLKELLNILKSCIFHNKLIALNILNKILINARIGHLFGKKLFDSKCISKYLSLLFWTDVWYEIINFNHLTTSIIVAMSTSP